MPTPSPAAQPAASPDSTDLAEALFTVSLTGIILFRPIYEATGTTIVDFAYERLNPAAQQMLRLPEYPPQSFLTLFPSAAHKTNIFSFYRDTFLAGPLARHQCDYPYDELASYFYLAAQRQGERLVVNFTDSNNQFRTAVEETLRQSEAHEQAARVEAERQRDEQQELLRQILRQVPAAIATLSGPDHRFVFANARYQDLGGHRATVGQTVAEALPEVLDQGIIELLDRVYQTGEPFVGREIALMLEQPPGSPHHYAYDFSYLPLRDGQGQVQGILVFAVDVTEQVRRRRQTATLQAALLAATQRQAQALEMFYQAFEQTPVAICIQRGPAHRFEYVNAAYQRYFPGRSLLDKTVREAVPETVDNGLLALLDQVYATGETYSVYEQAVLLHQPDGSVKQEYVTFTYQAYRENGEVVGVSTFVHDVAAQVTARHAREAQQQLLATVFNQSPAGVWVVHGPDYVFELFNPQMGQILGRSPAQALGRPYFEIMPELVSQGIPELLRRVWEYGESVVVEEFAAQLARHAPGQTGYFTFVFQPLRDEQGQVARISCVAIDVTAQVVARQQVQHLNEELTATNSELHASNAKLLRTNAELDSFVYTASHDLKTPIANIEGILHALRRELPAAQLAEPATAHLLTLLQESIDRFQTTIGHLTDIALLPHASAGVAEQVDLATLVESILLDLAPSFEATHAQLLLDLTECPRVRFATKNLRSILFNLLSNALKYRSPDRVPVVELRTGCTTHQVTLTVQDNGLGLLPEQQKNLFGLFQRFHPHVEGSGVGLYSIKKLIDNAGGTITVQSELGVGTSFTVTLPR